MIVFVKYFFMTFYWNFSNKQQTLYLSIIILTSSSRIVLFVLCIYFIESSTAKTNIEIYPKWHVITIQRTYLHKSILLFIVSPCQTNQIYFIFYLFMFFGLLSSKPYDLFWNFGKRKKKRDSKHLLFVVGSMGAHFLCYQIHF